MLGLALGLAGAAMTHQAVAAEQRNRSVESDRSIKFELPAQPLASALELYSVVSGWQIIYDSSLATGRRSTGVSGDLKPAVALQMLLAGTGLVPQYMAADSVMLTPDPTAGSSWPPTPAAIAARFAAYYGRIQVGLRRGFCAAPQLRSGAYRIAVGFWIGSSGTVTRAELLGSTGRADIDQSFDRAVRALSVEPPPAGFDQPVVVLVTPDLVGQCGSADTGLQPTRADP